MKEFYGVKSYLVLGLFAVEKKIFIVKAEELPESKKERLIGGHSIINYFENRDDAESLKKFYQDVIKGVIK